MSDPSPPRTARAMASRARAAARRTAVYPTYVKWKYRLSPGARQSYFSGVFATNVWGDDGSRSGSGSTVANTATLRAELPGMLDRLAIRTLLDLPCGDWTWMQHVDRSRLERYVGADIAPELIEHLTQLHRAPRVEFMQLDVLSSSLPQVDAVMMRDLLGHLDDVRVRRAVRNVRRSGAQWLLASHYPELAKNEDIAMGSWRPQNFLLAPYRWPEPVAILWERPPPPAEREDKALAAWLVTTLPA